MLSDRRLLEQLGEQVKEDAIAALLRRVLRIPLAWAALHEPATLERLTATSELHSLKPADIAFQTLDLTIGRISEGRLEALQPEVDRIWQERVEDGAPLDLRRAALLALGIAQRARRPAGVAEIVRLVREAATGWETPLAIALPVCGLNPGLIRPILRRPIPSKAIRAVINALLANLPASEAADLLNEGCRAVSLELVEAAEELGEIQLVEEIRRLEPRWLLEGDAVAPELESLRNQVLAAADRIAGHPEGAEKLLRDSWAVAQESLAVTGDQLAKAAKASGDPVTSLEARRKAVDASPSSERRAGLALALVDLERPEEALDALPEHPLSPAERLAQGVAQMSLGETRAAGANLEALAQDPAALDPIPVIWLDRLQSALMKLGKVADSIQIAMSRVERQTASAEARIELSRLGLGSGNTTLAAEQALLALALEPGSLPARRQTARCLAEAGEAFGALTHWQILQEAGEAVGFELAESALQAGEVDLALSAIKVVSGEAGRPPRASVLEARVRMATGEVQAAIETLRALVESHPSEAPAWVVLSQAVLQTGDAAEAGSLLQAAVQNCPDSGAVHAALSSWLRSQGRPTEALEAAGRALELDPSNLQHHLERADLFIRLGHTAEAQAALASARQRFPGSIEIVERLAELLLAQGKHAEVSEVLSRSGSFLSAHGLALAGRAALALAEDNQEPTALAEAITFLERATSAGLEEPEARLSLGEAYLLAEREADAVRVLEPAYRTLPAGDHSLRTRVSHALSRAAIRVGQPAMALTVLEQEKDRSNTSGQTHLLLSKAYAAAGLPDKALEAAQSACELDEENPDALRQMIACAQISGDLRGAKEAAERLTALEPDDRTAWLDMADANQKLGDEAAASAALARALWVGRHEPEILVRAATLTHQLGDVARARRMLSTAADQSRGSVELLTQVALASESCGDDATASRVWNRLVELDPENRVALEHAGRELWKQGQHAAAIGLWQKALAQAPDDPKLLVELGRAYAENGESNAAFQQFTKALEADPGNAALALEAGVTALRVGEPQRALGWLKAASESGALRTQALTAAAECLLAVGRPDQAKAALVQVVHGQGAPSRAYALLAIACVALDDSAAALEALDRIGATALESDEDAAYVSYAALLASAWDLAVDFAWTGFNLAGEISAGLDVLLTVGVRLASGAWLYRAVGRAVKHGPRDIEPLSSLAEETLDWVHRVAGERADAALVSDADAWLTQALNAADPAPLSFQRADPFGFRASVLADARAIHRLREGKAQEAIDILRGPASHAHQSYWSALILGLAHAAVGNDDHAQESFRAALKTSNLRPLVHAFIAASDVARGDPDAARGNLNAALALWADEPEWHAKLGSLYLEAGELDEALPHLQEAVELSADRSPHVVILARTLRKLGLLSDAGEAYGRAVQHDPQDAVIWKEAGEVLYALGKAEQALAWLQRSTALDPSDPGAWLTSAQAALGLGDQRLAWSYAQKALRLAPTAADQLLALGDVLARLDRIDQANQLFLKLETDETAQPKARLARSRLLIRTGRGEEAAALLEEQANASPEDFETLEAYAEACEACGRFEDSVEAAEMAIACNPKAPGPRLMLGRVSRKAGHLDRAIEELERAEALAPHDGRVHFELGRVYEDRRELDAALAAYERSMALDRSSPEAPFRAALLLRGLKVYSEAARLLKKAVELDPRNREALHQLAAVRALELVHGGISKPAVPS